MKRHRISDHRVFSCRFSKSRNCNSSLTVISTSIKHSWSLFPGSQRLLYKRLALFKREKGQGWDPYWCYSFILSVFFSSPSESCCLGESTVIIFKTERFLYGPKVWMHQKNKVAFMSKTNKEWRNPHLKLRSSIRRLILFFFSLVDFLLWL